MQLYFEKLLHEGDYDGIPLYSISTSHSDYRGLLGEEQRKRIIMEKIWNELACCTGEVYIKVVQDKDTLYTEGNKPKLKY